MLVQVLVQASAPLAFLLVDLARDVASCCDDEMFVKSLLSLTKLTTCSPVSTPPTPQAPSSSSSK
jgi:hypothetical protein